MGGLGVNFFFSEIQPDLVCELLTSMAHATAQFLWSPPPGALGRGQKVKYHKISVTKSISKKYYFVCPLTNERYKTYQTGFSFHRLGHTPGVRLRGTVGGGGGGGGGGWGGGQNFFFQIQPDLVCELLTSMAHATAQFFGSPPPGALGRGQKVKYHKISITKSISKIFKLKFACLLTNERYKTY